MWNKVKKLMHQLIHSHGIFYQLVVFTVTVSLLPLGFFIYTVNKETSSLIEVELIHSYKQIQAQYMSGIKYKISLYHDSLAKISGNTVIINTLYELSRAEETNSVTSGNTVSREIGNFLSIDTHDELKNCMIYSTIRNAPIYGKKVTTIGAAAGESWFPYYENREYDNFFVNKQENVLSFVEDIVYQDISIVGTEHLGFVKMDVYINGLFAPAIEDESGEVFYNVVIADTHQNLIYASREEYGLLFEENKGTGFFNPGREEIIYDNKTISLYSTLEEGDLQAYFFFDVSQLNNKKDDFQKTVMPVILIVFLIILSASFAFSRSFTRRINILVNKMQKAQSGDLAVTEFIEGKDEIKKLDDHFNLMLYKLNNMVHENYVQKLEKKETQLRNLRLQINPHFLYNTLETIGAIAVINKVYEIAALTEKLGEIFRYSLGRNQKDYVTLKQELLHTQNYIYIQKVRFGDKFEVYYNIDKSVENRGILRFILQPIVENAITHGLVKTKGRGSLEISAYKEQNRLVLKVEDDGIGMTREQTEYLMKHMNDADDQEEQTQMGIGIKNVNQRIKMVCGNEYGMEINSTLNQGSCFTIYLPLK